MQEHIVVTIGRSFGSGGKEIGEKLAAKMGISFYDKNLIYLAAEKSGIDESLVETADEKVISRFADPYAMQGTECSNINYRLYKAESQMIRELAGKESCVIVGRLADYVLKDEQGCFKVFIYAPMHDRIQVMKRKYALSDAEAKRLIKQMDKTRRSYYSYFTDRSWDGPEGRDLLVNSSIFGIDGTVDFIQDTIERWREKKKEKENTIL